MKVNKNISSLMLYNKSTEMEPKSVFSQMEHNIVAAYLIMAGILSLLSNIVVLIMFVKFKEFRTATNAVIANLAFTDIGVSAIGYPMSAASDLHGSWKFGYSGCQAYAALNIFFGMASIGLLTVVAIDRYLTISKPELGRKMTAATYSALIIVAWVNGLFWALMPVLGWANYAPDPTGATCTINWRNNDSYVFCIITLHIFFLKKTFPISDFENKHSKAFCGNVKGQCFLFVLKLIYLLFSFSFQCKVVLDFYLHRLSSFHTLTVKFLLITASWQNVILLVRSSLFNFDSLQN
ncbi:visual pigment-like receptor peropsin isoform X2 [Hypanus sabinus]|uniref:visual pigment-like receptor peropsin isoform X2 n=1 Tax=Hypanus sabinus TaxID=79690 RepID=UPI0028C455B0|nr:visual pigment-like receptor peropsin isoform X2 [Hypanus sabinus]